MKSVNRCAIGVGPKPPLLAWSQQFGGTAELSWGEEDHSLYLIPAYESREEAELLLRDHYEDIFANELDSWCRDQASWPTPLSYELFREWFTVRFYDLIDDLSDGDLSHEDCDETFVEKVRAVLIAQAEH